MALCRQVLPCPFETQAVGVVVPTTDPVPSSGPAVSHGHMHFLTCLVLSDSLCPPLLLVTEPGGRMTSCASRPCLAVCVWGGRFTRVGVPLSRANPAQPSLVTLDRDVSSQSPCLVSVSSLLRSFDPDIPAL